MVTNCNQENSSLVLPFVSILKWLELFHSVRPPLQTSCPPKSLDVEAAVSALVDPSGISYHCSGCAITFVCRLRSIAAHRDHFVRCLSVCACVCLSDSHTFLIVTHSYVSQATHAFLGMLPLCLSRLQSTHDRWKFVSRSYPSTYYSQSK